VISVKSDEDGKCNLQLELQKRTILQIVASCIPPNTPFQVSLVAPSPLDSSCTVSFSPAYPLLVKQTNAKQKKF